MEKHIGCGEIVWCFTALETKNPDHVMGLAAQRKLREILEGTTLVREDFKVEFRDLDWPEIRRSVCIIAERDLNDPAISEIVSNQSRQFV